MPVLSLERGLKKVTWKPAYSIIEGFGPSSAASKGPSKGESW